MKAAKFIFLLFLYFIVTINVNAENFAWPDGQKLAVSLSYDDSIDSQLDNVIPALNKHTLKASFYVVPGSSSFRNRFLEWKALVKQGHELGNHSLYHGCSRKLQGDWVAPHLDLDVRTVDDLVAEIEVANILLQAVDGKTERTFTVPCGNMQTKNGNYVDKVVNKFIAIKGQEIQSGFATLIAPAGHSGKQLIDFVKNTPPQAKLVNILFHGVGKTNHSSRVTEQAHQELINYLVQNKDKYWVDSYINIIKHVKSNRKQGQ